MRPYGYSGREEAGLTEYFQVLSKRRSTIITFTILLVVLVGLVTLVSKPVYRATAQLLIERENPNVVSIQEVMTLDAADTAYYQTQYKILQSRSLAKAAIDALRLGEEPEFAPKKGVSFLGIPLPEALADNGVTRLLGGGDGKELSPQETETLLIDRFLKKLEVVPVRSSRLVEVSIDSYRPELAAKIVNTLGEKYLEHDLASRLRAGEQALGFLDQQVVDLKAKVEVSEEALQRYKERENLIALEEKQNIVVQRLSELNSEVTKAKTERVGKETLFRHLRELASHPDMVEAIPAVIENRLIQELKGAYVALQAQHSKLSEKYGPRHPEIIKLTSQTELMKEKIRSEVDKIAASIETEYKVSRAKEATLTQALEAQKREALELNQKGIRYGALKREAESNKQLYETLLKRMKETNVTTNLRSTNIRIVDRAEVPLKPIKPRKMLNMSLALLLGLILGTGLAFLQERLDNSIKTPEDLSRHAGLPFLGPVPTIKEEEKRVGVRLFERHRSSPAEAYRSLRTSLQFSSSERPPQVILITSALPQEGKTTTAINLGYAFAQSEKEVVILDGDMRKPGFHKELGLDNGRGLSNFIVGTASLEEVLQPTDHPRLKVITCGPVPPNPSELLSSGRAKELLAVLKARFDLVIIDSPPVMAVTDPVILSKEVDGVVLVVKTFETSRLAVKAAKKQLADAGSKILGVVLNQVDSRREGYYYYSYYYYDYYGAKDGEDKAKKTRH